MVAVLVIGKRKGFKTSNILPHNIPITVLGAGLLWFGWFGFNGGSALNIHDGIAMNAFIVSDVSAAAAFLSWAIVEYIHRGKPSIMGTITGAVVGLAAITPAAGYVNVWAAIVIGLVVSPICYFFVSFVKFKLNYDDALDAFGCHGIGCFWGVLATGLFASKAINPNGADGLFYGNPAQLGIQAIGILVTIVFSGVVSFLILKGISLFTSLRPSADDEEYGMDITEHGETAYPDMSGE